MIKRRLGDGWIAAAWLLPFALYLTTLAPEVTTQDSGEFMTAIAYLGSAHSPGYPLFVLFAKPFTWLPIGSIAFTINLATASAAALISVLHQPGNRVCCSSDFSADFTVGAGNSGHLVGYPSSLN